MSNKKALDAAIHSIHRTFEEAEHQLSQLGGQLQFLIGPAGEVEIVRRGKTGEVERPKVVIAELKGCDPVLWRADCPAWLQVLAPSRLPQAETTRPGDPVVGEPEDDVDPGPRTQASVAADRETSNPEI